jgi:hypothetical protein
VPTKLCTAVAVGLTILSHPALANPYDDCILQHMGTAQNQAAVYAIERACIDKSSVPIPPDDNFGGGLNANVGEFNTGRHWWARAWTCRDDEKHHQLQYYRGNNRYYRQDYSRSYSISRFCIHRTITPGMLLSALGEPALTQIIKPGATQRFFVRINEAAGKPSDFGNKFAWGVLPTKGIPTN